ncbi:MAG TPA: nucleoside-diphosphate kinase [Candidatus Paceibacterota bacterium]|nr:nucleoside-diphosphate kinase [Candidatus Paceibacterota bacterium]
MKHQEERTLVIIKPDGIQRTLIGEIIGRYERVGFKLIALKLLIPSNDQATAHYMVGGEEWLVSIGTKAAAAYEKKGMKSPFATPRENGVAILETNAKYLSSGPVIAMIWQGAHVVEVIRKLTGSTEPRSSDVGSIRGDFVHDSYMMADADNRSIRNLIHASGTPEEAQKEIPIWFTDGEIFTYRLINEEILYDVNLDGILE